MTPLDTALIGGDGDGEGDVIGDGEGVVGDGEDGDSDFGVPLAGGEADGGGVLGLRGE